jgi:hypothetical protein
LNGLGELPVNEGEGAQRGQPQPKHKRRMQDGKGGGEVRERVVRGINLNTLFPVEGCFEFKQPS